MENNIEKTTKKFITNNILENLKKETPFNLIIEELNKRCDNMLKSICKNKDDLDIFSNLFLGLENPNNESINNRIKYMFFYITNVKKQIENIEWLIKNQEKFNIYKNDKLYKLCLFKEKISK
jgi:hypothetical protein